MMFEDIDYKIFRYKIVCVKVEDMLSEKRLDLIGNEGWELCGIIDRGMYIYYHFKKRFC